MTSLKHAPVVSLLGCLSRRSPPSCFAGRRCSDQSPSHQGRELQRAGGPGVAGLGGRQGAHPHGGDLELLPVLQLALRAHVAVVALHAALALGRLPEPRARSALAGAVHVGSLRWQLRRQGDRSRPGCDGHVGLRLRPRRGVEGIPGVVIVLGGSGGGGALLAGWPLLGARVRARRVHVPRRGGPGRRGMSYRGHRLHLGQVRWHQVHAVHGEGAAEPEVLRQASRAGGRRRRAPRLGRRRRRGGPGAGRLRVGVDVLLVLPALAHEHPVRRHGGRRVGPRRRGVVEPWRRGDVAPTLGLLGALVLAGSRATLLWSAAATS
mmetsp:Transcript_86796/g.265690  ORF Transcript_86796/g.265690 Transcript_86796/m.265690 type:complete len:321 (+) Transcript_86796:165-1127(+)